MVRGVGGVLVLLVACVAVGSACAPTPRDNSASPPPTFGGTVVVTTTTTAPPLISGTDVTSSVRTGLLSVQLPGTTRAKLTIPNATCTLAPSSTTISGQSSDGSQFNVTVLNPSAGSWTFTNPAGKPQVQNLNVVAAGKALGSPGSGTIAIEDGLATKAQLSANYGGSGRSQQTLSASWSCAA